MPFRTIPGQVPDPYDPINSRDLRFGIKPAQGMAFDTGRIGDVGKELAYDPLRDEGQFAGSPDLVSFAASAPIRGVGLAAEGVGGAIGGLSEFLNSIGPVKAYGETIGKPVGDIGGTVLDWIGGPGRFIQDIASGLRLNNLNDLPLDVQQVFNSQGRDAAIEYMREQGISFSNDKTMSLAASLILDPLNLTPFLFGKVALLPAALKVAGIGVGSTLGAAAGGVGLAVGGVSGYKAAGNIISKLPEVLRTKVGYGLSDRVKLVRAQILAGEKITEAPWVQSVVDIQDGLFGLTSGIGATVKAAYGWKVSDAMGIAFRDNYFDLHEAAASVFPRGTNRINVRRMGQATQSAALSATRNIVAKSLTNTNASVTELFVSDYFAAAKLRRADNLSDSIGSIMQKNIPEGGTVESRYGVSALQLEADASQITDILAKKVRGRIIPGSDYPDVEIWKARRISALNAREIERSASTSVSVTREAERLLETHDELLMREMTELMTGQVTREASVTGAYDFQRISVDSLSSYADTLAGTTTSDIARSAGPIKAAPDQVAHVVKVFTDGGVIKEGKIVGGRFFDEYGAFTSDVKVGREFVQRMSGIRHTQYGHSVNRVGNIRRAITISEGFDDLTPKRKASVMKEVSKTLGRPVSEKDVSALSKLTNERSARLTILRDDGLIDTEVIAFQKSYGLLDKAEVTAEELVEAGLRQDLAEELASMRVEGGEFGVSNAISKRKVHWARAAARQFEDIRNIETRGLPRASHEAIKDILDEAVRNDAMHSAASPKDLDRLRQIWSTVGGSSDEINDLIKSTERGGYRLGIAPVDNLLTVPVKMVISDAGIPRVIIIKTVQPFVDVTSDFLDGFQGLAKRPRVGYFNGMLKKMFAPIDQSRIQGGARQRLIISLAPWMTPDEIVQFDSEINQIASEQRLGVRGLVSPTGSSSQITKAANDVIRRLSGDTLRDRIISAGKEGVSGLDIDTVLLKAYAGDASSSGVTQWLTGQIKARGIPGIGMGKAIAVLTERFYPTLKYSVNPIFWIQEIIESPFFAEGRGIRTQEVIASLNKAGFTPQEVRGILGERTSSIAKNLNEAAFGTLISTRGGIPSTFSNAAEVTSFKNVWEKLRAKFGDRVDTIAEFKEGYRDIMALSEFSKRWVNDISRARPHEYLILRAQYGDDASELDLLLGHLNEYRRAQDMAWGDDLYDQSKPPGYGFAVSPSVDGLARVQERALGFEEFALSEDGLRAISDNRPSDVFRMTRLKIVDESRLSGFSVAVLRQRLSIVEETASRLKWKMQSEGFASINGSDELADYTSAVKSFREEAVVGTGRQSSLANTHEAILQELYNRYLPESASAPTFKQVITALSNGKRYGADFGPINNVMFEVYERAGGDSILNLTQQERATRIQKVIEDIINPNSVGEAPDAVTSLQRTTERISRTLSSSAVRMIEKHGAEEALMRASRYRYQETARQMDKINYFNPDRNMLERSMNHQFLGLYPLSYMFGKVLPEITRFMFWKPFGAIAPGAGYQAYNKFVEYMGREGLSPDFEKQGTERPDYMFFLAQLIPGHPDDIGVGVPGWLRRSISTVSRKGYDQLTAETFVKEAFSPLVDTGIAGGARTFVKSIQELTSGQTGDEQLSETVSLIR